jgi:hypothetical protein
VQPPKGFTHNFHANLNATFTTLGGQCRKVIHLMRSAFVLQLDSDTYPAERRVAGRIEEVDTGRELRFRSTDELLAFLCHCFELAQHRQT